MLVLFLALFGARTHEGHTYVVGTVMAMSDSQLVVNKKNGQTIAIQRDRHTRYRAASRATSRSTRSISLGRTPGGSPHSRHEEQIHGELRACQQQI